MFSDMDHRPSFFTRMTSELFLLLQIALLVALIRTFIFEPFYIPSGSMESTLQRGDFVFVWKGSYGYSKYSVPFAPLDFSGRRLNDQRPTRGDIAVFRNPKDSKTNYIKRIIGTPGDNVQISEGRLILNGTLTDRQIALDFHPQGSLRSYKSYYETLPSGKSYPIVERNEDTAPADNTQIYNVPSAHYFGLGDNRDASQDSRYLQQVGYIPEDHLIGRAAFIFFSIDPNYPWWELWRNVRFSRIGTLL